MKKFVQTLLFMMVFALPCMYGGCWKGHHKEVSNSGKIVDRGNVTLSARAAYKGAVNESARDIPAAYNVDVVVVGGTSGGVAAAVAAAQQGARVFLAAQRPYLGEDICGTYRLWLEPGETPTCPLARKVFAGPSIPLLPRHGIDFTYEADKPSADVHKDTQPASLLTDGKWHSAVRQSVQYDGDVTIIADLHGEYRLRKVHIMAYQRRGPALGNDFEVKNVLLSLLATTSNNGGRWRSSRTKEWVSLSRNHGGRLSFRRRLLRTPLI
jgi:hypothetical protein